MSLLKPKVVVEAGERLGQLRAELKKAGIDAFIQKIGDEYQGEYVPGYAQRLEWLTGFNGSAGAVVVTANKAALFVDGRYTIQAKQEVDPTLYEQWDSVATPPEEWIATTLKEKEILGFDPKLFTLAELRKWNKLLQPKHIALRPLTFNPIDTIWKDRPAPPLQPAIVHGVEFAGQTSADKRAQLAHTLRAQGVEVAVLTATDSVNWLLNIRGSDVAHNPVVLCFALLYADGKVALYIDAQKITPEVKAHLGEEVSIHAPNALEKDLEALGAAKKRVLYDPRHSSLWFHETLKNAGAVIGEGDDPCALSKACKNPVEIEGTKNAHLRDGVAVVKLLYWLDQHMAAREAQGAPVELYSSPCGLKDDVLSELSIVAKALACRSQQNLFVEPSFATIAGSGSNGAIVHYRVNELTNRALDYNNFILIDSGGQYKDGTTDITRTVPLGTISDEMKDRFTRVLKGHIALSKARFPRGTNGGQLDALARTPLWDAGLDFDHGTGHGVGSFLNVHEGPQRIGRRSAEVPLLPGMILSNEPGFYKTGEYGIRIETLMVVKESSAPGFLEFETLTTAPVDTRAIIPILLSPDERAWLNSYHTRVEAALSPQLTAQEQAWLKARCAPV